ncbi:hypothetical protein D3Z50_01055 [Clostridiaceae bacterium]|nr:AAA family ATPase [Clostridium sp.]NBI69671.1 hypothetical protein [Clostridiaceae bacterium]
MSRQTTPHDRSLRLTNCHWFRLSELLQENKDDVTLIARPRRFGKSLNMNMLERFFSVKYAGQGSAPGA